MARPSLEPARYSKPTHISFRLFPVLSLASPRRFKSEFSVQYHSVLAAAYQKAKKKEHTLHESELGFDPRTS